MIATKLGVRRMPMEKKVARTTQLLACVLVGLMPGTPATSNATNNAPLVSGIATVVDGDTLRLGPLSIRIHGIDAPEQGQTCQHRNGRAWD